MILSNDVGRRPPLRTSTRIKLGSDLFIYFESIDQVMRVKEGAAPFVDEICA